MSETMDMLRGLFEVRIITVGVKLIDAESDAAPWGEPVFDCDRFVQAWKILFHFKTKLANIVVVYKGCLNV
jgi:hypothetical protein